MKIKGGLAQTSERVAQVAHCRSAGEFPLPLLTMTAVVPVALGDDEASTRIAPAASAVVPVALYPAALEVVVVVVVGVVVVVVVVAAAAAVAVAVDSASVAAIAAPHPA